MCREVERKKKRKWNMIFVKMVVRNFQVFF